MNILVTGGAGYIGSHTAKVLSKLGHTPVTYDNLCHGHRWAVKWGPFEEGDILDGEKLRTVMKAHKVEGIIHFAGLIAVGESVEQPDRYYRTNVMGTRTLIGAMKACGVSSIVFSSSAAVYGSPDTVPIPEGAAKRPVSPYGENKLECEHMLSGSGLRAASLRYFNAAGADPEGELGEVHEPETHLIPLVLDAASGRRPHITIYGEDYATPDGTCIRDYIHVSDLAAAHALALKKLQEGSESFAVNLGTGTGISVGQIIATAEKVTGKKIPVVKGTRRTGDPPELVSDNRRAKVLLNWQPTRSDTATIIADAWGWHRKHFGQ